MKIEVFLSISLIVHVLLIALTQLLPAPFSQKNTPIEVQLVKSLKNSPKQIIRETHLPDKMKFDKNDNLTKFLSAQTQRVRKQMQAKINGMTKNRASNDKLDKNRIDKIKGLDAFAPSYKSLSSMTRNYELEKGLSSVGELIPKEVPIGSFTSLNTDRYLYYSFFSRIEDLIRFRWESMVKQTIDTTPSAEFTRTSINKWNTHLEIWLKPNGEFHSAHLMKAAGIKGFDQAAIQSFVQARVFPNPPKEMIERDGLIHLKYAFQVYFNPRYVARP